MILLWLYKLKMFLRKLLKLKNPETACFTCGYNGKHQERCYSITEVGDCDGWTVECGRCGELLRED